MGPTWTMEYPELVGLEGEVPPRNPDIGVLHDVDPVKWCTVSDELKGIA